MSTPEIDAAAEHIHAPESGKRFHAKELSYRGYCAALAGKCITLHRLSGGAIAIRRIIHQRTDIDIYALVG